MKFDIAIIGASTSGLYTAQQLSKAGKKVAIFEKQNTIEPDRRTYIITSGLERVLGDIPSSVVLHKIDTIAVETEQASTKIPLKAPDLIVERNQLTKYMAQKAMKAGAELHLGHSFQGFDEASPPQVLLKTEGDTVKIQAETVIGADGVFSQVAQSAGITSPPVVPLLQAEIPLPSGWNAALTKTWFNVEDTRYFYWLIPESDKRAVVGLVGEPGGGIRLTLDNFLNEHGFTAESYQVGQVAMHHPRLQPWAKVGDVDIFLVGDAAGQVKVTTVGGSVTGFWGAKAAVQAILRGSSYRAELRPLKRELDIHWYIRSLLEHLDNSGYDRLVRTITSPVQEFLARYNRDQMARNFWKLALVQPRFIPLGINLLFSAPHHVPLHLPEK